MQTKQRPLPLNQYLKSVSALSYGCMGMGGGWDKTPLTNDNIAQAHQVVETALESGINLFDHADIYTLGKAEKAFGKVLTDRPELRGKIYIQSKCAIRFAENGAPKRYDLSGQWVSASVDNILARLNTEYLDILMLHRPDPLMELDEIAETLMKIKSSGKVRHFGVANMHQHQMAYLQSALDAPLVVNQIEISLAKLDWLEEGIMAGNSAGSDINFTGGTLEYCAQHNVQVQAWGSLAQGLFSGRDATAESHAVQATCGLVYQLAAKYQVSAEAIVLAWLMRHPMRVQPVIGTTNLDRIKACAQAPQIRLTREEWYQLYERSRGHELP